MRLVRGTGLDALHLLGLGDMVRKAEEEEKDRRQKGSGATAAASPQHRGHHGSGRFIMARDIGGKSSDKGIP